MEKNLIIAFWAQVRENKKPINAFLLDIDMVDYIGKSHPFTVLTSEEDFRKTSCISPEAKIEYLCDKVLRMLSDKNCRDLLLVMDPAL